MFRRSVRIETKAITDWESFHSVFAETLGFPSFYGRNMNAWIDCLTYLDDPAAGMTTVSVDSGELLHLEVVHSVDFRKRMPEIFDAFIEDTALVNLRRIDAGAQPVLSLVLL